MFSRKETAELKKEFWTVFGQYMAPVFSAENEKINWINYKTGVKGVQFKLDAINNKASIAIEINHPDLLQQQIIFKKFQEVKNLFSDIMEEKWIWLLHSENGEGKRVSKIYIEQQGVSLMRREDWPAIISFFKGRLIALDVFWTSVKCGFVE